VTGIQTVEGIYELPEVIAESKSRSSSKPVEQILVCLSFFINPAKVVCRWISNTSNRCRKKWAFKLREDARILNRKSSPFISPAVREQNLDIFRPGHEGALFELLKHKIRGNNLESLGGSGRRLVAG
jgi:hypothetical protein